MKQETEVVRQETEYKRNYTREGDTRRETGDRRHDTEDRYIYSSKKVMGENFLKNTAQLRNFLLAKFFFPLNVAWWHLNFVVARTKKSG